MTLLAGILRPTMPTLEGLWDAFIRGPGPLARQLGRRPYLEIAHLAALHRNTAELANAMESRGIRSRPLEPMRQASDRLRVLLLGKAALGEDVETEARKLLRETRGSLRPMPGFVLRPVAEELRPKLILRMDEAGTVATDMLFGAFTLVRHSRGFGEIPNQNYLQKMLIVRLLNFLAQKSNESFELQLNLDLRVRVELEWEEFRHLDDTLFFPRKILIHAHRGSFNQTMSLLRADLPSVNNEAAEEAASIILGFVEAIQTADLKGLVRGQTTQKPAPAAED